MNCVRLHIIKWVLYAKECCVCCFYQFLDWLCRPSRRPQLTKQILFSHRCHENKPERHCSVFLGYCTNMWSLCLPHLSCEWVKLYLRRICTWCACVSLRFSKCAKLADLLADFCFSPPFYSNLGNFSYSLDGFGRLPQRANRQQSIVRNKVGYLAELHGWWLCVLNTWWKHRNG